MTAPTISPVYATPAVLYARADTCQRWQEHISGPLAHPRLDARLTGWENGVADDGSPLVSATIVGPDAARAVVQFGSEFHAPNLRCGAIHLDVTDPHATTAVWRLHGVWVELRHRILPDPSHTALEAARRRSRVLAAVQSYRRASQRHLATTVPDAHLED
ncbi:hypothetical protein [Streptomyces chilikensis]|uniref:Polyketide cyclase / dehydrase and lipid transport n=1 Tax=Streptomyces chilikensis TaxID=1194079 RepID=A0ABV3ERC2_9ACTN